MKTATKKNAPAKKPAPKVAPAKKKSGAMAIPATIHLQDADGWKDITLGGFKRHVKETLKLKADEVDAFLGAISKGTELELDPELDEKRTEFYSDAFAQVQSMLEASNEREEEAKAEMAELELEKAKERGTLALAGNRGYAMGHALEGGFCEAMQAVLGDDYEVTPISLHIAKGATLTEEGVANAIGTLVSSDSSLDRMRGSVLWQLGDLLTVVTESFPNHEEIITAVADVMGKDKHTIREARRLAQNWPEEDRMAELTATHHVEIMNYRDQIKPKSKLKKIIDTVLKGVETVIETTDPETGEKKEIVQNKPLSCGKLRALLQEAADKDVTGKDGADTGEVGDDGDEPPAEEQAGVEGFLYFDVNGNVFFSEKFSKKAAKKSLRVVDTLACVFVDEAGDEGEPVQTLDEKGGAFPNDKYAEETAEEAAEEEEEAMPE